MGNTVENLKRASNQLQNTVKRLWAGWFDSEEPIIDTVYWPIKDVLDSARALDQSETPTQRAFSTSPLENGDPRFIGREAAFETLGAAMNEWRAGRASMAVVHGPQGAGISSLLAQIPILAQPNERLVNARFCDRLRETTDVIQMLAQALDLDQVPASADELVDVLQQIEPRIIVLDDAHLLAFRVMGSHAAIRGLGAIMVTSQPRHLWIVGCHRYAWQRLVYLYQADRYFSHAIELDFLTTDELQQTITRRFNTIRTEIDWPNQDWQRLHAYSRGKPDLAFLYSRLLNAEINSANEQHNVLRAIDLTVLKSLGMDDLFTLAELAVHGNLRNDEHQLIFRGHIESGRMRLEALRHYGLIERLDSACGDQNSRYRISPLLSGLIADYLYKANYLY